MKTIKQLIIELYNKPITTHMSYSEIAKRVSRSKALVAKYIGEYKREQMNERK